jgi:hypothetical protein
MERAEAGKPRLKYGAKAIILGSDRNQVKVSETRVDCPKTISTLKIFHFIPSHLHLIVIPTPAEARGFAGMTDDHDI